MAGWRLARPQTRISLIDAGGLFARAMPKSSTPGPDMPKTSFITVMCRSRSQRLGKTMCWSVFSLPDGRAREPTHPNGEVGGLIFDGAYVREKLVELRP